MPKFTKLPVTIEAFINTDEPVLPDWFVNAIDNGEAKFNKDGTCTIKTLEGEMVANNNDYIIKGVKGEIYPCKPDIFKATYIPASDKKNSISPSEVEDIMNKVNYEFSRTGETGTYCTSYLGTFKLCTGYSGCVDPNNFNSELGEKYSKKRCEKETRDKVWELLGFELFRSLNK